MSVTVTGTKRHLDLNASTLTTTGNITAGGNIILSGSSNEIIKSNGSIRLNIDSDNNQGDRIFIVSHHNNTELFRVDEGGHGIFQGNATADSFIKSGGTSSQFLMADGSVSTSVTDSTKLPLAGGTMTGTLTNTQNGGTASIYINSTRPTLGFTDSNSFTDSNDVYIVRGTGGNKLQFQWYDNSAGTTTETFNIDNSGAATFAGSVTATQLDLENMGNYITFYGGGQTNHSIASRQLDGGTGDDIRLNTYGSFIVNLDSNNNQSTAANSSFFIGRHGGSASAISGTNLLFQIDGQTGNVLPGADSTHDLGTSSNRWANVYADTLYGDGSNLTGITASNADTVDNLHAASFLRSDADDTATGQIRIASSGAEEGKLIVGSSSQTNYVLQQWQTSSHGTNNAYIIAYGASHGSQAGNFAIKNTLANKNIFFEVNNAVPLKLENGTSTFTGNIAVSGTVDGRDIATDGTKLDTIDTNADVTPSWVPSSDPSYLTSSSTQSKYLRSDAADTGTGIITLSQNNATTPYPLIVQNASNADGVGIEFSDNSAGSQRGYITHFHADSKSYGSGASMIISSSEATTTILADGKLMYGEGIYSKPTSGTGAGTRKDQNWDTAYSWGNHASAGYLTTSSASTTYLAKSGGTMGGAINMSNFNITGVNVLTFNDPGPNEGISWSGGNTKIYESPNDLTTNTAGNLQFVYGSTRRLTVNSGGIDVNGNIVVSGTVDGVDIATRDGVLTSTTTTANAALPKAGGTMTGDINLSSGSASIKKTANTSGNYPAIELYSSGTSDSGAAIAIQQATSEGDTIIFADYEPHVEWGISAENGANEIHFTAGSSTNSLGSKTFKNNAGSNRTAYKKMTINLSSGNVAIGGTLAVSGTFSASGYNKSNWDTAYGWGNHADEGYLTSFDITTQTDSKYIRSNANDNVTGHTEWQDGYHVRLGNGADMRLYHSSGNNYIDCHTGSLYIRTNANTDVGGDIHLRPRSSENGIIIKDDAEVELYYNNALKMETTSGGISVQGSVTASGGNVGNLNTGSDIGQQMEYGSTSAATLRCDADRWRVYMGGGGQAREALTVLETGNVGVGDSTPSYKLDVAGTIRATGDVIAYSDERLKENIKTIDNSLEKVNKLRGVEFNKIGEDKKSIGVIAQEIENIIPEVVKTDDQGMKSVAYGNVVGLLIESIKELNKEVEELKTKLNNGN